MKKNSCRHIAGLHPQNWESKVANHPQVLILERPLLSWLPDEYLFSLVSRQHFYWGHINPSDTIDLLFDKYGVRRTGIEIDAVEILVARTGGGLGGALEILENHTLLRFYQLFMQSKERERYFAVRKDVTTQLKFPMALWNGKFTTAHPLKACAACLEDDTAEFGMPYWHLQHQYPGAWICLRHRVALQQTTYQTSSLQRFLFHLPSLESLAPMPNTIHKHNKQIFVDQSLLIHNLTSDMQAGLAALDSFRNRFIAYLDSNGFLNATGRLFVFDKPEIQLICDDFLKVTRPLLMVDEYRGISTSARSVHRTLSSYVIGKFSIYVMELLSCTEI